MTSTYVRIPWPSTYVSAAGDTAELDGKGELYRKVNEKKGAARFIVQMSAYSEFTHAVYDTRSSEVVMQTKDGAFAHYIKDLLNDHPNP